LGATGVKAVRKYVGEIEPRGQFHQLIGAERKCASRHCLAPAVITFCYSISLLKN